MGIVRVKKGSRVFPGIHEPLISKALFERAQQIKSGRCVRRVRTHRFLFSRLITCGCCGRSLIAEIQKVKIYYRCHKRHDTRVGLRGDQIEEPIANLFAKLKLSQEEERLIDVITEHMRKTGHERSEQAIQTVKMSILSAQQKIDRLTDAYIEGLLSKEELEQKKTALFVERREIEGQLSELERGACLDKQR